MAADLIFLLISLIITVVQSIIVFILLRTVIHDVIPRNILLINISFCDILTCLTLAGSRFVHSKLLLATFSFNLSSLLGIALISIDCYVAVKHCLRYNSIMNKRTLSVAIILCWVIPAVGIGLCSLEKEKPYGKTGFEKIGSTTIRYSIHFLYAFIRFTCSAVVICVAIYTAIIRSKHVKQITSARSHFHCQDSMVLSKLQQVKQSVRDTLQLNCCVVIFLIPSGVVVIVKAMLQTHHLFLAAYFLAILFQAINPFIYIFTQTVLRNRFKRIINAIVVKLHLKRKNNEVHPANGQDVESTVVSYM